MERDELIKEIFKLLGNKKSPEIISDFIISRERRMLEEIESLCKKYDEENGDYPESQYEGLAVGDYIIAKLKGQNI